ncbi:MAG: MTAP family purine nucleoside phosphorylase [Methanimicrococcus sp.]|nr:MTAP family purine nucleoside phosphorylase [Methanimicrococcus sp.]
MKKSKTKNVVLTVISGVGYDSFNDLNQKTQPDTIQTNSGSVSVSVFPFNDEKENIVFISRHQGKRHVPPHKINYKALIKAAEIIGAPVLAINSVGIMRPIRLSANFGEPETYAKPEAFLSHPFFIPNDFIDLTKNRAGTFYDKKTVHTDMTDPYCTDIRSLLRSVLSDCRFSYSEGIYLCTEGPRFETKAEIQMFSTFADVVGMTGVPEVVLAKEKGLCYASLCVLTNQAAGLSGESVTADEVKVNVSKNQNQIFEIVSRLADVLSRRKKEKRQKRNQKQFCRCKSAVISGKL